MDTSANNLAIEASERSDGPVLPGIVIAGFQKCGTTALYQILCHHPQIQGAVRWDRETQPYGPKELHFFDRKANLDKGITWYANHFAADGTIPIEATPEYILRTETIRWMHSTLPAAKLVLLMRDPVDRAFSAWNHWKQMSESQRWSVPQPEADFAANVRSELHARLRGADTRGLVSRGFYADQVEALLEYYDRSQIYFGFSHDLRAAHENEIRRIQDFLEVEVLDLKASTAHSRKYAVEPMTDETRVLLEEIYRPFDERLEDLLKRELPWTASTSHSSLGVTPPGVGTTEADSSSVAPIEEFNELGDEGKILWGQRVADTNSRVAIHRRSQIAGSTSRQKFDQGAMPVLARKDPRFVLGQIAAGDWWQDRWQSQRAALVEVAASEPDLALRYMDEHSLAYEAVYSKVIRITAQESPAEAANLLSKVTSEKLLPPLIRHVIGIWAQTDADAARHWIRNAESQNDIDQAILGYTEGISRSAPERGFALAERIADPAVRQDARKAAVAGWAWRGEHEIAERAIRDANFPAADAKRLLDILEFA